MPSPQRTEEIIKQSRDHTVTTATGNITLTAGDNMFQRIDTGGSTRTVTLPAEAAAVGHSFYLANFSSVATDLTVNDDGGSLVVTIHQNEAAWVSCDGTTWRHMGVYTVQQT